MAKSVKSDYSGKRLLANVSGMSIYSDSVYVVTGKMDESAPSGFQEVGISKAPFPGNKTISSCSWDKYLHVYDTGFFENSMCYKGMPKKEREDEVALRCRNIKEPFEEATGENLDQSNFSFWDRVQADCYDGRLFYTNDVRDLFDLYISLLSKVLTPKEEDGNPEFQNSLYCVEDKTTAVDVKKQRQIDKSEIIFNFMSMLGGTNMEQRKIKDLLLYLDVIHSSDLDPSMIRYMFLNWIESKNTNIDAYKDAYNRFIEDESEEGPEVIEYYRIMKEMAYSGRMQIGSSGISFENSIIGPDLVSASMALVRDKDLLELKSRISESYSEMKNKQGQIAKTGVSK